MNKKQVPAESTGAAFIRHYTSRAGDPHRHLHLQINARVWAAGAWRGIHSVGVRDSIEAINGIGHAAVATDPEFRAVLAAHGLTVAPETSEIRELAPYVGAFSARAAQIRRNVDKLEADWRVGHPDQEPGPRVREVWDRRAWAQARPAQVVPRGGRGARRPRAGGARRGGHPGPAAPGPGRTASPLYGLFASRPAEREAGPTRVSRGLSVSGRGIPRAHCAVTREGEVVGEVTSGTFSPTLKHGVAMALLDPSMAEGDEVAIDVRGRAIPATVVKPPFVQVQVRQD